MRKLQHIGTKTLAAPLFQHQPVGGFFGVSRNYRGNRAVVYTHHHAVIVVVIKSGKRREHGDLHASGFELLARFCLHDVYIAALDHIQKMSECICVRGGVGHKYVFDPKPLNKLRRAADVILVRMRKYEIVQCICISADVFKCRFSAFRSARVNYHGTVFVKEHRAVALPHVNKVKFALCPVG